MTIMECFKKGIGARRVELHFRNRHLVWSSVQKRWIVYEGRQESSWVEEICNVPDNLEKKAVECLIEEIGEEEVEKEKGKKKKPIPRKCPVCGIKLILNGEGWGFCDSCCCEITEEEE